MSHRFTRLAVAALAAIAVVPASAQAASKDMTSKDVVRHVEKAMKATDRLERTVDSRASTKKTVARLDSSRRAGARAARYARSYAKRAKSHTAKERAIGVLAAAGALQAQNVADYAALIDSSKGKVRTELARGLQPTLASRDATIAALQTLVERIDDPDLQAIAAQALAALTAQAPAAIEALATLDMEQLPSRITDLVMTAMEMATSALDHITGNLGAILPQLPGPAQEPVAQALATVSTVLAGLTPMIEQVGATVTSMVNSVMTMVTDLLGSIPGVAGILGGFGGGGSDDGAGAAPGGLFGGLGGLIPDLSGLPVVGGLLDSILGGLPIFGGRS